MSRTICFLVISMMWVLAGDVRADDAELRDQQRELEKGSAEAYEPSAPSDPGNLPPITPFPVPGLGDPPVKGPVEPAPKPRQGKILADFLPVLF